MPGTHKVAHLSQLKDDRAMRVCIGDTPILLIRSGDAVHALAADCPHAGAPLEEGAICNGRIVCPWHKGTFEVATGQLVEPPALSGLDCYPVTLDGDNVLVDPHPLPEPANAAASDARHFVVAGAGAAGAAACSALREYGFSGRITLIGQHPEVPYDRTALSKFVLSGEMATDDVPPLLPDDFFQRNGIERLNATIERVDGQHRTMRFAGGREISFDAALLATGGTPVVPPLPGHDLHHVHVLRSLRDARAIMADIKDSARLVVLGSSFIGLEAASALRKRNIDVTVVAPDKVPFAKQFGDRLGAMFQRLHEENGVTFRLGETVSSLEGSEAVDEVVLKSGARLHTDAVLLGTGVKPATNMIEGLALDKNGAVIVDATMRAAPDIYAAGDIASFPLSEGGEHVRIEHWRVAQQHARVAARNMCGVKTRYAGVPFFWTYHYGKRFDYLGYANEWDDLIISGDPEKQAFLAFFSKSGHVAAVLACDREAATARLAEAMRETITVEQAQRIVASS